MKTISIPVSDEIIFVLKKDVKNLQTDMMKFIAMQYFKEKQLSLGLSAKMAGMAKNDFVEYLGKNDIDIYQYTDEELQEEFDLADRLAEVLE